MTKKVKEKVGEAFTSFAEVMALAAPAVATPQLFNQAKKVSDEIATHLDNVPVSVFALAIVMIVKAVPSVGEIIEELAGEPAGGIAGKKVSAVAFDIIDGGKEDKKLH